MSHPNNVKEIELTDENFNFLKKEILEKTGIQLNEQKKSMVYGRLIRRLRVLKLDNFEDYLDLIMSSEQERQEFTDAITTNVTHFFREKHHFEFLTETVLPDLYKTESRIRLWSAGCSTGQEPYSIACTISETKPPMSKDIKILATDLSNKVLRIAEEGFYKEQDFNGIDESLLKKYFIIDKKNEREPGRRAKEELKKYITFNQLNLMNTWPFHGPFQVIFCRNVIIYFNKETQAKLFKRYADLLTPGGYLILGHSEHILGMKDIFEPVGQTIYKKIG